MVKVHSCFASQSSIDTDQFSSWLGLWFGAWFGSWFMVNSNILICKEEGMTQGFGVAQPCLRVAQPCLGVAQPCLGVAQPCLGVAQPRKVVGGWPSRLYGGPAGYMVGLGKILVSAPVPLYLIGPFNWV